MKYSILTLMELSQESVPCRWTVGSKYCKLIILISDASLWCFLEFVQLQANIMVDEL